MPRFYRRLTRRLAGDGPVSYHPISQRGGLGRTDLIVDAFREHLEQARDDGVRVQLAGHSLGGIVAWVLAHEYPDVVEVAELWSTPVRGTALSNVVIPIAEARFLARASRWLRRYDRPISGPLVRSIYTTLDQLAVPASQVCYVEGDTVENHVVTPVPLARWQRRPHQFVHRGVAEHVFLPRLPSIHRDLALLASAGHNGIGHVGNGYATNGHASTNGDGVVRALSRGQRV